MRRLSRVLALALALALAGCAGAAGDGNRPTRGADEVREELQETYEATWGDPRTRRAAEVLAYVEHEERLAECLAGRGAGHVPAPFADATAREPGPLSWYDVLLPVDPRADALVPPDRPVSELAPRRTWPGPAATPEDIGACVAGPPQVPALAPDLDAELYDVVTAAVGGAGRVEGYAACMGAAGFEAATRDDLVDDLLAERAAGGRPGPREDDAVAADAACRSDAHRAAMAALDEPLRSYRARHADRLSGLPARAQQLQREARAAAERIGLPVTWW